MTISLYNKLLKSDYHKSALFVLPCLSEASGIATLEATLQRVKIAITEVSTASYVYSHYPSSIIDVWRSALNADCTDVLSKHVVENYTWGKTARDIAAGCCKTIQGMSLVLSTEFVFLSDDAWSRK